MSGARFQPSPSLSLSGNNSQAQKFLASHIPPCFTVRNMSSQMNDYPTLQYTTDLCCSTGAKEEEKEGGSRKKWKAKQSWVVPAALPSVTVMAAICDMLKQLSWEVVEIILDCFHLKAPDSPLGIPARVKNGVLMEVADVRPIHLTSGICDCRNKLLFLSFFYYYYF